MDIVRTHHLIYDGLEYYAKKKKKKFLFWPRKPQNESTRKPPNKADSFKENELMCFGAVGRGGQTWE